MRADPSILFLDQTGQLGGAELSLCDIVENWQGRKRVVLFEHGPFEHRLSELGLDVQVLLHPLSDIRAHTGIKSLKKIPAVSALISDIAAQARDFDLIHTNSPKAAVVGIIAARLAGRPVVVHVRDILTSSRFSDFNRRPFIALSRFADRILVNSDATLLAFTKAGGSSEKAAVVYNGFSIDHEIADLGSREKRLRRAQQLVNLPDSVNASTPIIGCFSRFADWKGQHILVEAFERLTSPACLILCGAPLFGEKDYEERLRRMAKSLPDQKQVVFTGFRNDPREIMRICDLIVHPSIDDEPFGRALVESQLCRRPVIATAAGGTSEIIEHGRTGFLVKPNSAVDLTHAIEHCILNESAATQIGAAGFESAASKFALEKTTGEFRRVIIETLSKRGAASIGAGVDLRRPNLGINGHFLQSRVTGVERYALKVLEHLVPRAIESGYSVTLFAPKGCEAPDFLAGESVKRIDSKIHKSALGHHFWEQVTLPAKASLNGIDVLTNLTNTAPIGFNHNFITVHDLSWIENPEWFSALFRAGYNLIVGAASKRSLQLITVSQTSANQISKHFKIQQSKIAVLTEGVGANVGTKNHDNDAKILQLYGLTRPYLLHVGTLQPRKNIARLLAAHQKLCGRLGNSVPELVLAGGRGKHFGKIGEEFIEPANSTKFLGYVPEEHLNTLYTNALAYVSASLSEGFNLPIVEAMAAGTPVICSDIPIHHEVAADAAVYFDPLEESAISGAMELIATDEQVRTNLIQLGYRRASQFSWQEHAAQYLNILDSRLGRTSIRGAYENSACHSRL